MPPRGMGAAHASTFPVQGANVTAMQARLPDDRKNVASIMPAST